MRSRVAQLLAYRLFSIGVTCLLGLCFAGSGGCWAAPASGSIPSLVYVEPSEDELMLMALQLGSEVLSDTLEVYVTPNGLALPLGEICRLLSLGITVDLETGTAGGFISTSAAVSNWISPPGRSPSTAAVNRWTRP